MRDDWTFCGLKLTTLAGESYRSEFGDVGMEHSYTTCTLECGETAVECSIGKIYCMKQTVLMDWDVLIWNRVVGVMTAWEWDPPLEGSSMLTTSTLSK